MNRRTALLIKGAGEGALKAFEKAVLLKPDDERRPDCGTP